jgi:ComF family protein
LSIYQKTKNFILDTLFPITCVNCNTDGNWLCRECQTEIPLLDFQVCPRCEKIATTHGQLCETCQDFSRQEPFSLDNLVAATEYQKHNLAKIIHLFKYNFIQALAEPLGELLVKAALKSTLPLPDFILPVPLHPRRLRWRGFNQSTLLANFLSQKIAPGLEIPVLENLLQRKKYTSAQMKVADFSARKYNVQNAFFLNPASAKKIKGRQIWLIDDVATTAATLRECAKTLKQNGAGQVSALVVARQDFAK